MPTCRPGDTKMHTQAVSAPRPPPSTEPVRRSSALHSLQPHPLAPPPRPECSSSHAPSPHPFAHMPVTPHAHCARLCQASFHTRHVHGSEPPWSGRPRKASGVPSPTPRLPLEPPFAHMPATPRHIALASSFVKFCSHTRRHGHGPQDPLPGWPCTISPARASVRSHHRSRPRPPMASYFPIVITARSTARRNHPPSPGPSTLVHSPSLHTHPLSHTPPPLPPLLSHPSFARPLSHTRPPVHIKPR
jgi:hypothetical protein